jgi:hypothetical protein
MSILFLRSCQKDQCHGEKHWFLCATSTRRNSKSSRQRVCREMPSAKGSRQTTTDKESKSIHTGIWCQEAINATTRNIGFCVPQTHDEIPNLLDKEFVVSCPRRRAHGKQQPRKSQRVYTPAFGARRLTANDIHTVCSLFVVSLPCGSW